MKSTVKNTSFREEIFQLFRELVDGTPWKTARKEKTAGSYVKTYFLEHQNSCFPFARNQASKARDEHG